jgi:hypothetical protein
MKYLKYKNTHWSKTQEKCKRDNKPIYQEVLENGFITDHYCCERDGCTSQEYRELLIK